MCDVGGCLDLNMVPLSTMSAKIAHVHIKSSHDTQIVTASLTRKVNTTPMVYTKQLAIDLTDLTDLTQACQHNLSLF